MPKNKTEKKTFKVRCEGVHVTLEDNEGKILREFVTDPSFFILESDSENHICNKARELIFNHADKIKRSYGKWRNNV